MLCIALAASIFLPAKGLLLDGIYGWHIRQKEFTWMMAELAAVAAMLGIIWLVMSRKTEKWILTGVIAAVFAWLHVVAFPMVISALYVGYLFLTGWTIRTRLFRDDVKHAAFSDFLSGSASVIVIFCICSAMGIGTIPILRYVVLFTGAAELLLAVGTWKQNREREQERDQKGTCLTKIQSALVVFMIVMVLLQIGRMGISLDFDSLWYGVRSEYMLNSGGGIYENPGTVGLVYTYSKGLEVLLLPLADLPSHSYLIFFNVWTAVLTLAGVYQIGRFYMNKTYALLAAACVSSIPAVMNMSITAKADSMTLLVQVLMVLYSLHYLKKKQAGDLLIAAGAYLLSLTLKPTAVVFSTAVFGMTFLYLLVTRRLTLKGTWKPWFAPLAALAALIGIWARTVMITGIPVTSVFSSLFSKMGFQLKYPFADIPLYGGGGSEGLLSYLWDTLYKMALLPVGETMNHVVFAWGTSLMFFLIVVCLFTVMLKKSLEKRDKCFDCYAMTVLIPFILVCLVSLLMLGQIDGNYFMLLYVFLVLVGCTVISRLDVKWLQTSILIMLIPILLLNVTISAVSNWAWSLGFTPVQVINNGYVDHEAAQEKAMKEAGNTNIWEILAKDPQTRVIAAGNHPQVFDFPCNVQSYDDITSSWGNVVLVKTMDNFIEYLDYAKTDYVYMQAGAIERESRCYELMGYLIEAGILKDVFYEDGNLLARVDLWGEYGPEAAQEYELYFENFRVN